MPDPSYIIGSGWWCDHSRFERNYRGDDVIRTPEFHRIWYRAIDTFTDPVKILIVDSASPVPPPLADDDPRIERLTLVRNAGHVTRHTGRYSGWTESVLIGLRYAACSDVEYFVYVEQDALLYGKGIIERCIRDMRGPYMFGSAEGTPHPLQQSFFIVHRRGFEPLARHVAAIRAPDREVSPEKKFSIATSPFLRILPIGLFRERKHWKERNRWDALKVRLHRKILRSFQRFDPLPVGVGGYRTDTEVDFEAEHFYFQHASQAEVDRYVKKYESEFGTTAPRVSG